MTNPVNNHGPGAMPVASDYPAPPAPTGTGQELLGQVFLMLDEQRGQARKARRTARQLESQAAEDRIGKLRESADFQLAGAVVQGASQIASAGASAGAASAGSEGASQAEANWGAMGKAIDGGGTGVGGALNAAAGYSTAEAERHGAAAQVAKNGAADGDELMRETAGRAERAMGKLEAILQAQIDAQSAALRRA